MSVLLIQGDARSIPLADHSVHCVVTSPPYWGLRDYGTAKWEGGSPDCDHQVPLARKGGNAVGTKQTTNPGSYGYREWLVCGKCGAQRIDKQLGLEKTPDEYIRSMVEVFREVKRVLRDDGTLWLNMGDSYAGSWGNYGGKNRGSGTQRDILRGSQVENSAYDELTEWRPPASWTKDTGLKPKDLVGVPWMLAFALRADGWYLRSDIIWSKPNPMPESVTDWPTKAHEYIFLLSKSERYYYDAEAIKEEWTCDRDDMREKGVRTGTAYLQQGSNGYSNSTKPNKNERLGKRTYAGFNGRWDEAEANGELGKGRNKRTVWEVGTQPFPEPHFATFPEDLIKPCILAGTSLKGACAKCGTQWERIVERNVSYESGSGRAAQRAPTGWHQSESGLWKPEHVERFPVGKRAGGTQARENHDVRMGPTVSSTTLGWEPLCKCGIQEVVPCTVLDPFIGSGTAALVARHLQCHAVGMELNPAYLEIAKRRLAQSVLSFTA